MLYFILIVWLAGIVPAAIKLKKWQDHLKEIPDLKTPSNWRLFFLTITWPLGLLYLIYFWIIMMLAYKNS